jgi:hypothetical protein
VARLPVACHEGGALNISDRATLRVRFFPIPAL